MQIKLLAWMLVSTLIFVAIPLLYIGGTREVLNLVQKKDLVFTIDTAEAYRNYLLYKSGISGSPDKVVVGRGGWLFLGDHYGNNIRYSREAKIDHAHIAKSVRWLQERQDKLLSLGSAVLQILPPNKLSVYPEYAPQWFEFPNENITDVFARKARTDGLQLLDLRADMVDKKQHGDLLYYKTDSHWNDDAGLLAYRRVIASLRKNIAITAIDDVVVKKVVEQSGGNSQLLKINGLMPANYETGRELFFPGSEAELCISDLGVASLEPENNCNSRANSVLMVTTPLLVVNESALNDLTVIWYRDSFGTAMSSLMQGTFKRIWEVPYHYYYFSNVECFVQRVEPDIVLFMSVERNLIDRLMTDLPGPTPRGVAESCQLQ